MDNIDKTYGIISIIGVIVSLTSFIIATNLMDKIDINLLVGIFASLLSTLIVYFSFYFKNQKSEFSKTRKEIDTLRESIKQLTDTEKDKRIVFISYNHKDKELANRISSELEKANFQIWDYEKKVTVGENWEDSIYRALSSADYFLYLISKNNIHSNFVSEELIQALKQHKKILPVLIDDSKPEEFISSIKYANIKDDYLEGIEELLKSLKTDIEKETHLN